MPTRLYAMGPSHPARAGIAMLRHKRQILSGVRVLLDFEDLAHLGEGRPCAAAARSLFPTWIGPIPRGLPAVS
jgi:hypothetical protein